MPIKSVTQGVAVGATKLVGRLVVALAALAALGLALLYVVSQTVPAKSAEVFFPELNFGVKL
jgi:hypothetical protein